MLCWFSLCAVPRREDGTALVQIGSGVLSSCQRLLGTLITGEVKRAISTPPITVSSHTVYFSVVGPTIVMQIPLERLIFLSTRS